MRKTLASLVLYGMSLFNPLNATTEEIQSPAIERLVENMTNTPSLELIINYETETSQSPIDYVTSMNVYSVQGESLHRSENNPQLSSIEETQIEEIINDIQNNNITSYQEFLEASENLSENQQLVLTSAISYLLYSFNYDISLVTNDILSQDDFFSQLQDSLIHEEDNPIGTCGHIATHIERFLNETDVRTAAVSGISDNGVGHIYNIVKIENGTAIVDAHHLLIADTRNIEKTLEAKQKQEGTTVFQHLFFEDTEFKYRLIPEDGQRFLDFVGYDESSESLKNSLVQDFQSEPYFRAILNRGNYINSFETNLWGFFIKAGEIIGESSSPMQNISTIQAGFKRNFPLFDDKVIISPDLSFIEGNLIQDAEIDDDTLQGVKGNLIVNTNRERGFNLTSRVGGAFIYGSSLFYDLVLGTGASYTASIKNTNIEPYIVSQFSLLKENADNQTYRFFLSELNTGIVLDSHSDNSNFSITPYYLWRIWEQGFGGEVKLETRDINRSIGINARGQITFSTYDFCPDKYNLSVGVDLNLGNLEARANIQTEGTNYDGERETQESFNLQGSLRF